MGMMVGVGGGGSTGVLPYASMDPGITDWCKILWDMSQQSEANEASINTLTDFGPRTASFNLDGTGHAPTCKTAGPNGLRSAVYDGSSQYFISGAAASAWRFWHSTAPFTVFTVFSTAQYATNKLNSLLCTHHLSSTTVGRSLVLDDRSGSGFRNMFRSQCIAVSGTITDSYASPNWIFNDLQYNLLTCEYGGGAVSLRDNRTLLIRMHLRINGVPVSEFSVSASTTTWGATDPQHTGMLGALNNGTPTNFFLGEIPYFCLLDATFSPDMLLAMEQFIQEKYDLRGGWNQRDNSAQRSVWPAPCFISNTTLLLHQGKVITDNPAANNFPASSRSVDGGKTWTKQTPTAFAEGSSVWVYKVIKLISGRLLRIRRVIDPTALTSTLFLDRSDDNGTTWTELALTGIYTTNIQSALDLAQAPDGTVCVVAYGKDTDATHKYTCRIVRSSDEGESVGSPITVLDGDTDVVDYTEPTICISSNTDWLILARHNSSQDLDEIRTTDGGDTWGSQSTVFVSYSGTPYVFKAASGKFFVLIRILSGGVHSRYVIRWKATFAGAWSTNDYFPDARDGLCGGAQLIEDPGNLGEFLYFAESAISDGTLDVSKPFMSVSHQARIKESDIIAIT